MALGNGVSAPGTAILRIATSLDITAVLREAVNGARYGIVIDNLPREHSPDAGRAVTCEDLTRRIQSGRGAGNTLSDIARPQLTIEQPSPPSVLENSILVPVRCASGPVRQRRHAVAHA